MLEVINLALPFFGLIFLGFGCGKFKAIPDSGLAWMDFFILYVALPAIGSSRRRRWNNWPIRSSSSARRSRPFVHSRSRSPSA
jgi:hypothetical protein